MLRKMILIIVIMTSTGLFLSSCTEERDYCEEYCDAEGDCADYNQQKSSTTECKFYCKVELERHKSIHCGREWEDYLDCKMDLSCSDWGNDGKRCANEIDWINSCSGSGS